MSADDELDRLIRDTVQVSLDGHASLPENLDGVGRLSDRQLCEYISSGQHGDAAFGEFYYRINMNLRQLSKYGFFQTRLLLQIKAALEKMAEKGE